MEPSALEGAWLVRGRTSLGARVKRWRSKSWQVAQCALAAGVAWLIADLLTLTGMDPLEATDALPPVRGLH